MTQFQKMVNDFHVGIGGQGPDAELRVSLIQEEAKEFMKAVTEENAVEAIDALCDLLYVTYGTADVFHVELDTEKAENTPVKKLKAPLWKELKAEMEDFDWQVGQVVQCIRTFKAFNALGKLKTELTDLADGCWSCSAEAIGVDLRPFYKEVHRTNMHKLKGPKRADGKQLKPEGWKPPRIKYMYGRALLGEHPDCVPTHFAPCLKESHAEGGSYCGSCGGVLYDL